MISNLCIELSNFLNKISNHCFTDEEMKEQYIELQALLDYDKKNVLELLEDHYINTEDKEILIFIERVKNY